MDRLKKFYVNGILMTAVTLIMRYVSVNFNIYISNKIGAVSMGIFTLVSSVYGFALTIATSGINLATTKLVSEAMGIASQRKDYNTQATVSAVMKKSLLFSLTVSSFTAIILFLSSNFIGNEILRDDRTVSSLQILAFSLPPIAISSSLCGYFTALRKVYKNALVQILGQLLRIFLCVVLLTSTIASDMESACVAIVIGMTLSEISAFAVQAFLYILEKRKVKIAAEGAHDKKLTKKLIPITLPVALSAYMRSALITIEHLLIPWGLEKSGNTRDISLAAYGTLHSVVFPLVLFPSAISSSFAGLLVPEISESDAAGDKERIERIISRVLKTALIYSIGVAGVMMCLSNAFGEVIFPESQSGRYIALIAPLIPIMYLDTSVDSILKGLGYQFYSMVVNIADALMSVVLVWLLLPRLGISGYIITVYFTEIINATLSITKLLLVTKTKVRIFEWIAKPIFCSVCAAFLLRLILKSTSIYVSSAFSLVFAIIVISLAYILFLVLCGAISPKKISRSVCNFIKK